MSNDQKVEKSRGYRIAFWIAVLRGVFAVLLGLALILNPEKNMVRLRPADISIKKLVA